MISAPAIGLGYYLWRQARPMVIAASIYLLLLACAVQVVPAFASPLVTLPACAPLGIAIWYLLAIIILDPSDLSARDSGFPNHMRCLPVTTSQLVRWPMLYGVGMVLIALAAVGGLVLAPMKTPMAPVLIATSGFTAFLLWQSAITWWPSPILFGRFIVFMFLVLLLGGVGAAWFKLHIPIAYVCLTYFMLAALAYPAAVKGVSLARRGDGQNFPFRLPGFTSWLLKRTRGTARPFRSPTSAMLWLECRRNLILAPATAVGMCLFMFVLFVLNASVAEKKGSVNLFPSSPVEITGTLLLLTTILGTPTMFFTMLSGNLGKFDFFAKEVAFPSFALVRPISSSTIIAVKLRAIALSVTVTAVLVFGLMAAILLLAPASDRETIKTLIAWTGVPAPLVLLLVIAGWMALQWRNSAVGMLISLTGRKWIALTLTYAHMGIFAFAGFAIYWMTEHRSYVPRLISLVPWLLVTLLVMKLALMFFILRILNRRALVPPRVIFISLAVWLGVAAVCVGALLAISPPRWQNLALIALFIPFNRLIVAPLAMEWNRHR